MISWHTVDGIVSVAPDPRFISFQMHLGHSIEGFATEKIKSVAMSTVSKDRDPEFFFPNSHAQVMAEMSFDGSTEIFTVENPYDVYINGNSVYEDTIMLFFQIKRCDRSQRDDCASDAELQEYLDAHRIGFVCARRYIDYS